MFSFHNVNRYFFSYSLWHSKAYGNTIFFLPLLYVFFSVYYFNFSINCNSSFNFAFSLLCIIKFICVTRNTHFTSPFFKLKLILLIIVRNEVSIVARLWSKISARLGFIQNIQITITLFMLVYICNFTSLLSLFFSHNENEWLLFAKKILIFLE